METCYFHIQNWQLSAINKKENELQDIEGFEMTMYAHAHISVCVCVYMYVYVYTKTSPNHSQHGGGGHSNELGPEVT